MSDYYVPNLLMNFLLSNCL